MWYCNQCKEHKEATKRMSVSMLPKVLVLHLKRFRFRNSVFSDKINRFVDFPTEGLDMAPFVTFHRDSSGTSSVPNSPAGGGSAAAGGEHEDDASEGGASASSLQPGATGAASSMVKQGDSDAELLNNKELKDYRASLDTWRHRECVWVCKRADIESTPTHPPTNFLLASAHSSRLTSLVALFLCGL